MTCLLAFGLGSLAPAANAASAGQSFLHPGEIASNNVIEIRNRGYGHRLYLPIVPYIAYDYPYYYSRGYYPTHIGPGYVYYGYPSNAGRSYEPKYGGRCSKWERKCAANWGDGNEDFYGCLDYHGCD
jgi:hypothetical protein